MESNDNPEMPNGGWGGERDIRHFRPPFGGTGRVEKVELSKEEIPGSKRSMYGYVLTYSRL